MLDPGLASRELFAIRSALAAELDASRLRGFAASLAPEHACAASLLHARSAILDLRSSAAREAARAERERRLEGVRAALRETVWDPHAAVAFVEVESDPALGLAALVLDAAGGVWSDAARGCADLSTGPSPWPTSSRVAGAIEAGAHPEDGPVACAALVADQCSVSTRDGGPAWSLRLQLLGFPDLYTSLSGAGPNARAAELFEMVEASRSPFGTSPRARAIELVNRRAADAAASIPGRTEREKAASTIRTIASGMVVRDDKGDGPLADVARSLVADLGRGVRAIDPLRYRAFSGRSVRPDPLRAYERARWCAYYA